MTDQPDLFSMLDFYIDELFARDDAVQLAALAASRRAGLPEIQISAGQGKFLYLLARLAGARRILEIGTLGGYSTIWLARALPPEGRLITLEADANHARVAAANIARAGFSAQVEVVVGPAVETLPGVIAAAGDPFDVVFLDADKVNYCTYFDAFMQRVRPGSLILADNVIRAGTVLAPQHHDPSAGAARAFNAMLAADARLEAVVLQQVGIKGHDGIAIARVR